MNCKQNCYFPIKRKINLNVETFERKKRRVKVQVLAITNITTKARTLQTIWIESLRLTMQLPQIVLFWI